MATDDLLIPKLEAYRNKLRRRHREKRLAVGFNGDRGFFVQAPAGFQAPAEWEPWWTGKQGETRYTVPELTELVARLREHITIEER